MPNPTVIATQLDSAELEKSIESLVQTFETKFNKIKEIVDTSIASIENRIMGLGKATKDININVIESSTSTKGKSGASVSDKRAESLKREAQGVAAAVEQYDKLLGALQQATRQKQVWDNHGVENLNKKETRAYEQNLKRIIELQKQMRESAGNIWFARATANEQAARFDAKGALNSITAVDDRLKQLNTSFKQMQAESRRLFNQELSDALKAPAKSLEQLREKLYNLLKLRVEGISREFITPAQLARVDEVYAKEKARLDNMRAVSTTQSQTHQQTITAMTREEQIAKRIADQVRRSTEYQRTGVLEIFKSRTNRSAGVEVSRGAEERGYSLEEQILRIIRQRAEARAEENRRVNISLEQHRQMQQYEAQGLAAVGRRSQAQQAQSAAYTSWTNMVARVLGIQEKELLVVKDTTGSYEKMSAIVKQLSTAYNKLSADTRNSEFGRQLAEQINLYRRMMSEVQAKMSRPQSLASIKELPTNTLEQMRDKVQQLRLYMQGLNTTTIQGRQEMRLTQQEIDKVTKKQRELLGVNEQLTRSNNTLSRAWTYMKNRLAFYLTVGASTSFVRNLIEVRGQYELTERALGVLIDSAEKGSEIFRELSQMALVSPYTLIELSQAARQLTAYGVEAENIVDTTRRIADVAAAVGAPISNIAYALGHVQSYGYLTSLQARQFANAGIPLVKALAEEYTKLEGRMVSVTDVYDRIKHKQVEYSDVMNVVNAMTDEGGRFFDFQAKTADTLKVQLANLTLAWNNMLNEIGTEHQSVLEAPIKGLKNLFLMWKDISNILTQVVLGLGAYKVAQLVMTRLIGTTARSLKSQILAEKSAVAAKLRLKKVTETLTAGEERALATSRHATAEDYRRALAGRNLTKSQAMLLLAFNKRNVALREALIQMKLLTAAEARSITITKAMGAAFKLAGIAIENAARSMAAFFAQNWIMLLIGFVAELAMSLYSAKQAQEEFNKAVADAAKENAKKLGEFRTTMEETFRAAKTDEFLKLWDSVKEEIIGFSAAGELFVRLLNEIPDVGTRIGAALDWAKRIEETDAALSDLFDSIKVNKDIMGGLFGEGLAEDLDDLNDRIKAVKKEVASGNLDPSKFWSQVDYDRITGNDLQEAYSEIDKFAKSVHETLSEELGEGIKDGVKVREALELIKRELKAANPEIRGAAEALFDLRLDEKMWELTSGAINANDTLMQTFLERLKRDHAAAFADMTTATTEMSDAQMAAIRATAEGYRAILPPEYAAALDQMLADMNSRDWVIHIKAAFDVNELTDVMKSEREKFIEFEKDSAKRLQLRTKYMSLLQKETETTLEHEKRLKEEAKKVTEELAHQDGILSRINNKEDVRYIAALKLRNALQERLTSIQDVATWHGYDISDDKKKKSGGGSKKDPLGDALSKEVKLISDIQKRFNEYRKMGVTTQEAIAKATDEYSKSILNNNKVLEKYGFATLSSNKLATLPLQKIRDFYTEQLRIAQELKNTKGVEALEKAVASLNVEITKIDYKRITDGLNNELSKLKEDYELSVELYGNPELGEMFTQMFGLNTDALPRSFAGAYDKANEIAKKKLQEAQVEFEDFDLLGTLIEGDKDNLWRGLTMDSELVTKLKQQQKTWRDIFKKNLTETEKELDDYVKKYGERADKMAEIEAERLEKIKKLNDSYKSEELKRRPDYIAKFNAINLGAFRSTKSLEFEDFKGSELYIKLFENLDYVSTTTLQNMRAKLQELKSEMGALTPTQLKEVTQQMEKLDEQLAKRDNPFVGLAAGLRDYIRLLRNRGEIERKATVAQAELDSQQKTVDALAKQYEQLKRKKGVTKEELEQAAEELAIAKAILKGKKAQAQATADELSKRQKILKSIADNADAVAKWADTAKAAVQLTSKIAEDLGASEATKEIINDIGTVLEGIGEVANGMKQLSSENPAEVVAGAISVLSGIWTTIAAWFDNSNKRITRQVEESERHVKRLQNAYEGLAYKVEKAMGTAETAARRAAIANKKLQLAELERQLALERSRKAKNQDEDKMIELEGSIASLKREINDDIEEVTNNLAGADIKSAAEAFVDAWVDAWREGETTLDAIEEKMDEMIFNIIKKSASAAIVGKILQPFYDALDEFTSDASESGAELTTGEMKQLATLANKLGIDINTALGEFYGNLESLGVISKTLGNKDLSALQQGIQGITEETANAIEAYLNGMSGQMYYHSTLLEQIRDAMTSLNGDTQLGVQAQMLLQLQQSYAVQTAIQGVLEGWSNANGMAVRVEMV